ncbi:hypothetical protein [Vibrio paucivorans]|uniref:Uncharacterized protein n=1 Tax=Vibrio paucivorans TaxID=2829489 RepID=A0A9X3CGD5_9VIBR|nr:hypothetical protein [Vibrio paucivorans]MCW8335348.1 hypothetical protein [Vibrio paucivorans]
MKVLIIVGLLLVSANIFASSEVLPINLDGYADKFRDSFSESYRTGPNFDHENYLFTYSCGGGAICGSVYDVSFSDFVELPDNYIGASEVEEFHASYNINSNRLCISGQSAITLEVYQSECYRYQDLEWISEN